MSSLSVVIAAYNEQRTGFLAEQLEAIICQKIQPDEVILIDDGSQDGTADLMRMYASGRSSWQIIALPENVGCAEATNIGVRASTGTHVYIASANDVVRPGAFAAMKEALHRFPGAQLITGDVGGLHLGWGDESGNVVTPSFLSPEKIAPVFGPGGIIHAAGTVIARTAWDFHGGWDASYWPYSETLTWHITALRFGVVYVPWSMANVRQHAGSASKTVLDREWRRPIMERAANAVIRLEEPTRSRLLRSKLWGIAEWNPDMLLLLRDRVTRQYADARYRDETGGLPESDIVKQMMGALSTRV